MSEFSISTLVGPIIGFITGACVAGVSSYFVGTWLDKKRREHDANETAVALYIEVADRAARCLNDHIEPWSRYAKHRSTPTGAMDVSRVGKFRPTDPIIYQSLAGRLGIMKPEVLAPTVQFYFRLDALRREIDTVTKDFSAGTNLMAKNQNRVQLIAQRFHETLRPALRALEVLNIEGSDEFDAEAAAAYQHVANSVSTLRDGLEHHASNP
jgi:hypothetical protein